MGGKKKKDYKQLDDIEITEVSPADKSAEKHDKEQAARNERLM